MEPWGRRATTVLLVVIALASAPGIAFPAMPHGDGMMAHGAMASCGDGACGVPVATECAQHCLAARAPTDVIAMVATARPWTTMLTIVGIALIGWAIAAQRLRFALARAHADPRRILTTIKRE